jgi:hypothetical protein
MRHQTEHLIMMPVFYDSRSMMIGDRMVNAAISTQRGSEIANIHQWDLK